MSGLNDDSFNSNSFTEPGPGGDGDPEPGEPENSPAAPVAQEPDLFRGRFQSPPFRASTAAPPDLTAILASQRGLGPNMNETPAKPIFKISSAEPDWSQYTLPPLNEEPAPAPEESGTGWQTAWAVVREVGETILLTLVIFFLIQTVIRNFRVVGTSMVDNLHDGQYLIIDKLTYTSFLWERLDIGGPQRGDVVVFEPPNRPGEDYVKRVIGLPGEKVEIKNGRVFINGTPLEEPFQPVPGSYTMPNPVVVPPNQVFVLGDNRNNSNDSHNWGTLPIKNIVGRAWVSYWPPQYWGTIPRDAPSEQATLKYFLDELVPGANAGSE